MSFFFWRNLCQIFGICFRIRLGPQRGPEDKVRTVTTLPFAPLSSTTQWPATPLVSPWDSSRYLAWFYRPITSSTPYPKRSISSRTSANSLRSLKVTTSLVFHGIPRARQKKPPVAPRPRPASHQLPTGTANSGTIAPWWNCSSTRKSSTTRTFMLSMPRPM